MDKFFDRFLGLVEEAASVLDRAEYLKLMNDMSWTAAQKAGSDIKEMSNSDLWALIANDLAKHSHVPF